MFTYFIYLISYLWIYSVVSVFAESSSLKYDACLTPERNSGKCIAIIECPSVLNLLKERPISAEKSQILQRSNCGFVGKHAKVCCPLSEHSLTDLTTMQPFVPSINATTPSLTTHYLYTSATKSPTLSSHRELLRGQGEPPRANFPETSSDLLPTLEECGFFTEDRSSNDDKTQLDGYPWMVLLEYETPNGRRFHCGGSLINNRYVLTAAHCVSEGIIPNNWNLVSVRLGEYDLDTNPDCEEFMFGQSNCCCTKPVIDVGIMKRIVHPQYDPNNRNQYHDIALLRLARNITFSEFVRPVCLQPISQFNTITRPDDYATIGGWGFKEHSFQSTKKQAGTMQIKSKTDCESKYADRGFIMHENQLCTFAETGKTACYGDSGGALINNNRKYLRNLNYFAIGVMSFGNPVCALQEYPIVYTKVEKYIPWIISNLKP